MDFNPIANSRVGLRQRGSAMIQNITRQQSELERVNQQLASGRRLEVPSDDPSDAAVAMQIRKRLEAEERYESTLRRHTSQLAEADTALAEATEVVRQVRQIALDMANSGVSQAEMDSQVAVVLSAYEQLVTLGNSQIQGSYLFAGDNLTEQPFVRTTPGVRYRGGDELYTQVAPGSELAFTVDGGAAFGGHSARVESDVDLNPLLSGDTRLADLRGVADQGITPGSIFLSNGTDQAVVELEDADSVQDVLDAINNSGVPGLIAATAGPTIQIINTGGGSVTLRDVGGTVARDFGIASENAPAGAGVAGGDADPVVNELTPLASIPVPIDWTSGLTISLGTETKAVDFTGSATVGDMLNRIRGAFPSLEVGVNDDGRGFHVKNGVQSQPMRIRENGGTTAADLGLNTFEPDSLIEDLNGGDGLRLNGEGPDLEVVDSAGNRTLVELGGLSSVGDVVARINASVANVTASFGAAGIDLTDTAGGPGEMSVRDYDGSAAATDLGIRGTATAGTLQGADVNPVEVRGVFGTMELLADALRDGDIDQIRRAAARLEADEQRVIRARGETGARAAEFERRLDRAGDRSIGARKLLGEIEDVDYGETVARFQTLQLALEATYRTGGSLMQLSLMDFLR